MWGFAPFLVGLLFSINARAQPQLLELRDNPLEREFFAAGDFLVPNEPNPSGASPILQHTKPGLIVGVGSDRVLFDYLMANSPSGVLAVDYDPQIVRFHRLNNILLRITPLGERNIYSRIRKKPNAADWKFYADKAVQSGAITGAERVLISDPDWIRWWSQKITGPLWDNCYRPAAFPGVNYLEQDNLFQKIQNLALAGKYQAHQMDLGNPVHLREVVSAIKAKGMKVSVLDLSNAWEDNFPNNYLGTRKTGAVLAAFNDVAAPSTIVLAVNGSRAHEPMRFRGFRYHFFRTLVGAPDSWSGRILNWEDSAQRLAFSFSDRKEGATSVLYREGGTSMDWTFRNGNCPAQVVRSFLETR